MDSRAILRYLRGAIVVSLANEDEPVPLVASMIAVASKSMFSAAECRGFLAGVLNQAASRGLQEALLDAVFEIPREQVAAGFRDEWRDNAYRAYGYAAQMGGWEIPAEQVRQTPRYYVFQIEQGVAAAKMERHGGR